MRNQLLTEELVLKKVGFLLFGRIELGSVRNICYYKNINYEKVKKDKAFKSLKDVFYRRGKGAHYLNLFSNWDISVL